MGSLAAIVQRRCSRLPSTRLPVSHDADVLAREDRGDRRRYLIIQLLLRADRAEACVECALRMHSVAIAVGCTRRRETQRVV
jgi:hypothetical protein